MNSNPQIDKNGTKRWYNEKGQLHRDDDLPAIEWANGTKSWWKNGNIHREQDKPAVEYTDGNKLWYKNGIPLFDQQVEALQRKWNALRNRDTTLLAEELLNEL